MIKTIVIDDENKAREIITDMLKICCDDISVVAEAYDVQSGQAAIGKHKPDLILLDIKMPDGTGFDLLRDLDVIDFQVIFKIVIT